MLIVMLNLLLLREKKTIEYYESVYKANGCKETVDLVECITNTPNSTGFLRPTTSGSYY